MLSPLFYYKTCSLKFKTPKFDYKQNIQTFLLRFVGMGLRCDTFNVVIFWIFFHVNLWPHLDKAPFELESMQIWLGQNFIYFYIHYFNKV
jgi:hypothetical protein